jgi:GH15 family glucan-1,4-alpha-glucosidase
MKRFMSCEGSAGETALIDRNARIVWYCLPRFDGDPVFHQLMGVPNGRHIDGAFSVEMEDVQETEQTYVENTAIVRTVLKGSSGAVEIIDFAPRYESRGRAYRPQTLVRRIRPLAGTPHVGLMFEDIKPDTREAWGNFPQTYSMVGIINAARLLSSSWDVEI